MLRGFVLGVVLLAAIGVCTVMETSKQTQARYRLDELNRREDEMKKQLARLHTEEQKLRAPSRLVRLARQNHSDLVSLVSAAPDVAENSARRRPGQVLDEESACTGNRDTNLASAGQW